jgi:type II secretory pathway pseudopilin PulG
MKGPQLKRMTIVIAVCAAIGAIAGIAGSAAAPSSSSSAQAQKKAAAQAQKKTAQAQKRAMQRKFRQLKRAFRRGAGPAGRFGPGFGPAFGFGPVHAEAVVPNKDGTGFMTVTTDAGTLNSVDGNTVHLKEGTDKKVYKDDVAIDVGSNAKVIRNRADAKLSDLKAGDHVRVITGTPKGSIVIAEDDAFLQQQKKHFREHFGHRAFGPGFGPPGPPPGAPGPPSGWDENGSYPGGSGDGTNG